MITLVIIGVIAAITVPTLINKTNNQEYVSKLKKAYSTLAQATNLIIAEEGPATEWATSRSNVFNLYQKKLVNAKVCGTSSECLPQGGFYKKLNGDIDTYNVSSEAYHKLVLSDGVQIIFSDATNLCNINFGYTENPQYCAKIFIDINGAKKPNTMGRDYFGFALKKNSLVPMGCEPSANCETSAGSICTCKVLREGAINY
ncbi:hypothetical protein IKQ26_03390 [bacterium]|nr:hypothetical protein [bacterium]